MLRDYLGPPVTDSQGRFDGGKRVAQCRRSVIGEPSRKGQHRPVRDLDATEPMLARALDTAAEMVARASQRSLSCVTKTVVVRAIVQATQPAAQILAHLGIERA